MLRVKKLDPDATLPTIGHTGEDLCYDLYSVENIELEANSTTSVRTGIAIEFDDVLGFRVGGSIEGRSSIAVKGVHPIGGQIDCGYRNEVLIVLRNTRKDGYHVFSGQKIAQIKPQLVLADGVIEVKELSRSTRGTGGFGSTDAVNPKQGGGS